MLLHFVKKDPTLILVFLSKRYYLSCVQKAVCSSQEHNLVFDSHLDVCGIKIRHFGNGLGSVLVASFRSRLQVKNVLCEIKVSHLYINTVWGKTSIR